MKYDSLFDPMVLLFVGLSYVLTLLVGSFMVQEGNVTVGNLVTFISYLDMLVWPLMAIGFSLISLKEGRFLINGLRVSCPKNHL